MSLFRKEINADLSKILDATSTAMTNTMIAGWGAVTTRSAVDTGRYRAAWNIAAGQVDDSVPADKGKPAGHKHGSDLYGFSLPSFDYDVTTGDSLFLSNNVEYANKVDAIYGDVAATTAFMQRSLSQRMQKVNNMRSS